MNPNGRCGTPESEKRRTWEREKPSGMPICPPDLICRLLRQTTGRRRALRPEEHLCVSEQTEGVGTAAEQAGLSANGRRRNALPNILRSRLRPKPTGQRQSRFFLPADSGRRKEVFPSPRNGRKGSRGLRPLRPVLQIHGRTVCSGTQTYAWTLPPNTRAARKTALYCSSSDLMSMTFSKR